MINASPAFRFNISSEIYQQEGDLWDQDMVYSDQKSRLFAFVFLNLVPLFTNKLLQPNWMHKKIQATICWYFGSTISSEGSPNGYIAAKSGPKIESARPGIGFFFCLYRPKFSILSANKH